ncbi:MAG: carbon-nitrogen hydrolase family protein [Bacillota bacterium]
MPPQSPEKTCKRTEPPFRAAVCQFRVGASKQDNLARAREFIRGAAGEGARLVVLPEMFVCPYEAGLFPEYAESSPGGQAVEMLSRAAREEGVYIVGGSIPEREGERLYNSSFVFDPAGKMLACHRKVYLFDVDLPGGLSFRESATLTPGRGATVVQTPLGRLGVAVCFDIRFPALFHEMVQRGAEIIVVPAAFNMITGPAHWELLLRTRAVDNQVYMIGAAPARNVNASYVAFGHSTVVNPWGEVLARAGPAEEIIVAEIDLQYLKRVREQLPVVKQMQDRNSTGRKKAFAPAPGNNPLA